ncbi:MAG: hypothetical protein OXJ55_18660 [Caldilineaceae bacterium]|nr:hypothetical protein [Caldilineaceae bacterium]
MDRMNEKSEELLNSIASLVQGSHVDTYKFAHDPLKHCFREICVHMSRMEGEIEQLKAEIKALKG